MTALRLVRNAGARLAEVWWQIWFQPSVTAPLELARIGIGAALLEPLRARDTLPP